ncbi:MAG: hypothetical protein RIQ33_1617 [Bacteroidota bacterium]|jgi:hypothetical protein
METTYSISQLSPYLFWDVDVNALEFEKSKSQIIYKVVEFGQIKDWNIIKSVYGLEIIKETSLEFRTLDDVTLAFLSHLFQTEKSKFRCYKHKQSNPNYWHY